MSSSVPCSPSKPQQAKDFALLSISIVTYKIALADFTKVLASLISAVQYFKTRYSGDVTITLIDNGQQGASLKTLIGEFEKQGESSFKLITGLNNVGYGKGHNLAILTTEAQYHLILNPDIILEKEALVEGVSYIQAHTDVSAVAPFAIDGNGKHQYLCKSYPNILDLFVRGFAPEYIKRKFNSRLARYELHEQTKQGTLNNVPIISGCFMLCDVQRLKAVGGFDESYFLYFEDFALSMELGKAGKLSCIESMRIQHFGGNSARKGLKHIFMFIRSGIHFFNTYGWKFF